MAGTNPVPPSSFRASPETTVKIQAVGRNLGATELSCTTILRVIRHFCESVKNPEVFAACNLKKKKRAKGTTEGPK